jgi:carboxymethylenebutenolidase
VLYLRNHGSNQIGSLGWCFGGQQSLQLSLNEPLDATVIYYGNLVNDTALLSSIKKPVLGIFGSNDTSISVQSVAAFESSLDALNISNEIYMYPGVGHAFANPSNPNFAPNETIDAWQKTLAFLDGNLK